MNSQTKSNKSITVFSTPTCPWCTVLKKYLVEHNVTFKDVDVSKDYVAATNMVMKSGQMGVPQLWVGDDVVIGFDKNRINSLLSL